MHTSIAPVKCRTNRNVPVEQWPESLEILNHLQGQHAPQSIKEVAHDVCAPEISTRNRLARLEVQGAVKAVVLQAPGKHFSCLHYAITQYGRDVVAGRHIQVDHSAHLCVNSVFALARAMKLA